MDVTRDRRHRWAVWTTMLGAAVFVPACDTGPSADSPVARFERMLAKREAARAARRHPTTAPGTTTPPSTAAGGSALRATPAAGGPAAGVAPAPGAGAFSPATRPSSATRPAKPLRLLLPRIKLLFLGNSYTRDNRLAEMIQALATEAREFKLPYCYVVAPSGASLAEHWMKTSARRAIHTGGWDWVILQAQSTMPIQRPEQTSRYARQLDTEIRNIGAKTMLFLTWARANNPTSQADLNRAYVGLARDLKASLAPVGLAWSIARTQRPGLALHRKDHSHPTVAGTYLSACVFYSTLYHRTPQGLPGRLSLRLPDGRKRDLADIPPTDAMFLQSVAWEAVRQGRRMMKR